MFGRSAFSSTHAFLRFFAASCLIFATRVEGADPENAGRERWSDRIFHRDAAGRVSNLTDLWQGAGPAIVRNVAASLRVFQKQSVRTALRLALATSQEEAAG